MSTNTFRNINDIALIYKHTCKDYRGSDINVVMYGHPERGTVLGAISDMPESVYTQSLVMARKRECKAVRDEALRPIFALFGIEDAFKTNQNRDSFEDLELCIAPRIESSQRAAFLQSIANLALTWPSQIQH